MERNQVFVDDLGAELDGQEFQRGAQLADLLQSFGADSVAACDVQLGELAVGGDLQKPLVGLDIVVERPRKFFQLWQLLSNGVEALLGEVSRGTKHQSEKTRAAF